MRHLLLQFLKCLHKQFCEDKNKTQNEQTINKINSSQELLYDSSYMYIKVLYLIKTFSSLSTV